MLDPPEVFCVPAWTLMMGKLRVTAMVAVSLSKVTSRGVDITCASFDWFRNERTALDAVGVEKECCRNKSIGSVRQKSRVD